MLYRLYAEGNFRRCYSGGLKLWAGPRLLTLGTFAVGPVDLFTWLLSPHLHHTWYVIVICPHVMVKTFQTRDNDMWLLDAWWWTETKSILCGLETKEWELRDGEDETMLLLSQNLWRSDLKQCRSTRCLFGTRTPPCNPAGWTVRRSLHRLTGWIHANESFLLNIGHTIFRQLGIKYKYLEFLAEGTLAMTTTSSTSLAIPMRQHVQSGERHLQDHDIHLQNHHN